MVIDIDKKQAIRKTRNGAAFMFGVTGGGVVIGEIYDISVIAFAVLVINAAVWLLYTIMLSTDIRELELDDTDLSLR